MLGGRSVLQWRALASSKVCGKNLSWEGVWPYLDPMDSVCLRTPSMELNVPGKYGPHGELFFFLIQKTPATEQVGEIFSPFFNATSVHASFLLMSSRSARLSPCASGRKKKWRGMSRPWSGRRMENGLPKESNVGEWRRNLVGRRKVCLVVALEKATWATMRCTSSGCMGLVTRPLFSCRIGSWQRWH